MSHQKLIDKYLKKFYNTQGLKVPIELNSYLHRMIDEALQEVQNVKVTKTGDGELMVYKEDGKGGYINLIIDGGVEIMYITSNRKDTWNKVDVSVDEAIEFWNEN